MASDQIGGNLKLLRQSTNADRKRLKIAFSIANCRFRLPTSSALLDSRGIRDDYRLSDVSILMLKM